MKKDPFSKIAIIAGDANLAETVCRRFRKPGKYLSLFAEPRGAPEKWGVLDRECVRICNAISFLQPAHVLLLGCSESILPKLLYHLRHLSNNRIITLKSFDKSVLSRLPGYRNLGVVKRLDESATVGNLIKEL